MNTASPFHSFDPKKYIPRRYSPLFITVVEEDVESLCQYCGLSFTDYFAAIAAQENPPIRVIEASSVQQEPQDCFFGRVSNDTTIYSQSFVFPEYEEKDVTVPQLSPVPGRFPSSFHYPSPQSMKPPWYTTMLEDLLSSMQFSDFDFCDFPVCIIYATLSCSGLPTKKTEEVRKSIPFPDWMLEFITDVPIIRIVVYDGLLVSKPPNDVTAPRGAFSQLLGLCFRTRRMGTPGAIDPVTLRNMFQYDEKLMQNPQFFGFLSETDLENCRQVIRSAYQIAVSYIDQSLKTLQFEYENSKQLSNRVKNWFSKKAPDRVTDHMQVPWRKMIQMKIAALNMILGRYELARKSYRQFNSSIHDNRFPELRIYSLFMAAMAAVLLPNGPQLFREQMEEVIQIIQTAKSIRFLLMVPAIGIEFNDALMRNDHSLYMCRIAISRINSYWQGNAPMKSLFLALFHERFAGLLREPQRHSVLQTARAAIYYKQSSQVSHSLRCFIWLFRVLPRNSWVLLYQNVWLEKAATLCALTQWARALNGCKDLLALPDLDKSLHERVISQFWAPFNDSTLDKSSLHININSLLEVRSLTMIDKTHPSYWGLPEEEFSVLIKEFDEFVRQSMSRTTSVSFDSWYDEEDKYRKSTAVRTVGIGTRLILTVALFNRYKFSVHLDRAILHANYEGDSKVEKNYEMEEVRRKDILGFTRKTTSVNFNFVPLSEGKYTIDSFLKNYWGYVDTEVKCGPLVFSAIKDSPLLKMEILDFPEETVASQCYEFSVNITNVGNTVVNDFIIVHDNPNTIVSEHKITRLESINIISVHQKLEPFESALIEMVVWADPTKKSTTYHFCAASNGLRCAFYMKSVKIAPSASIESVIMRKENDTDNMTFHCMVTSRINDLEIIGVIDNKCRFLKLVGLDDSNKLLQQNESVSFVGFSNDAINDETAEKWRANLMGDRPLAVLYRIQDNGLYAQSRLNVGIVKNNYRLKLTMPNVVESDAHSKIACRIALIDPPKGVTTIYVEPQPMKFIDQLQNGKRKQKDYDAQDMVGCPWFGVTRRALCADNNYSAEFLFVPKKGGVFNLPAVKVSLSPSFAKHQTICLSQNVRIIPK